MRPCLQGIFNAAQTLQIRGLSQGMNESVDSPPDSSGSEPINYQHPHTHHHHHHHLEHMDHLDHSEQQQQQQQQPQHQQQQLHQVGCFLLILSSLLFFKIQFSSSYIH